jgi:hypothetical protein
MKGYSILFSMLGAALTSPSSLAQLYSTSSDPTDRAKELSEPRCATTYKRMLNFAKYWPPGRLDLYENYNMYNPKKVGFLGYELLGDVYFQGCAAAGLPADKIAAASWYFAAALAHVPDSQWKLGRMMFQGDGVPENREMGLGWITSAALEGSAPAAAFLTSMGEVVPAPIQPSSWDNASNLARQKLASANAEQRRAVLQGLGNLVVSAALIYSASGSAMVRTHPANYASNNRAAYRPRPVYCQYQASANSFYPNHINVRVTQFCQ